MEGPVGLVVVGTDAATNQRFVNALMSEWVLLKNRLAMLSPEGSLSYDARLRTVETMREAGAKTVVLFYLKAKSAAVLQPGQGLPTSDDVDYLVDVSNF